MAGRSPIFVAPGGRDFSAHRALRAWALAALGVIAVPAQSVGLPPPTQGPWLTPGCKIYSTRHWRTPKAQCEVPTRAVTGGVIRWDEVVGRVMDVAPEPDRHGAWVYWIEGLGNARALQLEGHALRRPIRGELVPIRRRSIFFLGMLKAEEELPGLARELRLALLSQSILADTVQVPQAVIECEFNFDKAFDPRRNCILPDDVVGLEQSIELATAGRVVEAPTAPIDEGLYSFKAACEGVVLRGVSHRRPRVGEEAVFIVSRSYFPGRLAHIPFVLSEAGKRYLAEGKRRGLAECMEEPQAGE